MNASSVPHRRHFLPLSAGYYNLESLLLMKGFVRGMQVMIPAEYEVVTDGVLWNVIKL